MNSNTLWHHGKYIIARSQDQCKVGAWVMLDHPYWSVIAKKTQLNLTNTQLGQKLNVELCIGTFHHRTHPQNFEKNMLKEKLRGAERFPSCRCLTRDIWHASAETSAR
jgi:hypothetical protein